MVKSFALLNAYERFLSGHKTENTQTIPKGFLLVPLVKAKKDNGISLVQRKYKYQPSFMFFFFGLAKEKKTTYYVYFPLFSHSLY